MSEATKFCNLFRIDMSPGKRYYKRLPMSYGYKSPGDILDMQTHEEQGIKLELAISDFEKLMMAASEGMLHQRFRQLHLAAQDLYEQAKKVGIPGRSKMNKEALIDALRNN